MHASSPLHVLEPLGGRQKPISYCFKIDIANKPDEEGNCVIKIRTNVIDSDHFGDYTDALETFGEEW